MGPSVRIAESAAAVQAIGDGLEALNAGEILQLLGELGRLQALAAARLTLLGAPRNAESPRGLRPLLTVPEVAKVLKISEGEVYRRSKGDLRPAAVALGPGGLRFDERELEKVISARTGV